MGEFIVLNHRDQAMTESEREATRRRLLHWLVAAPELDEQRWRELLALIPEQGLALTRALLGRKGVVAARRLTSGLVEQQALFQRGCRP